MQIENRNDGLDFRVITSARRIGYTWNQPDDTANIPGRERSIKNLISLVMISGLGLLTISLSHIFAHAGAQWAVFTFWAGILIISSPVVFQLRAKFTSQATAYTWRADAETGAYYRVPVRHSSKAQTGRLGSIRKLDSR